MVLLLKSIVSILQLVLCSAACAVTRTPKCHHITRSHSEITLLTNNESKSSIQSSCPTHNCIKTGHQSGLHSILSFTIQCFTRSSSLITRNRSSVTSGLKMSNWSFYIYHFTPVVWNGFTSHLIHAAHHSTSSSTTSGSCISDLSTSHFLKNWSPSSSAFLFLFLTCILTWPTLGQISLVLTLLSLLNSL